MKIGVLLSGNGVYDGTEIHEAVFTLFSIHEHGAQAVCMAPDIDQLQVINHLTGDEMNEQRNVLIESARIARGQISSIELVDFDQLDALVLPGGFGAAKNLTTWAISGPEGTINDSVKAAVLKMYRAEKPIVALCMAPTVLAKALENENIGASLTVGTTEEKSPYEIGAIGLGMESIGAHVELKTKDEICVDVKNKIITAPCYMMEASISDIRNNVKMAIDKLFEII